MKPKKIWANLAVENVERTSKFYTDLGFKPNGKMTKELTSFLVGEDDFIMHFFIKSHLENFLGKLTDLSKGNEIVFTLGADSKAEVDQWAKEVTAAGGTLVTKPEEFGEGYYGFIFADPDGHKFNVFYM